MPSDSLDNIILRKHAAEMNPVADNCGIIGMIGVPNAARQGAESLATIDDRGKKGSGIVTFDKKQFHFKKEFGNTESVFHSGTDWSKLPGDVMLGHSRYATKGHAEDKTNLQPFVFSVSQYGPISYAHNGQLLQSKKWQKKLLKGGALLNADTDSEIIGHHIARSDKNALEGAIQDFMREIPAAYSVVLATPEKLFAFKDRYGVRPLSFATFNDGHIVASETVAFDIHEGDAEYVRHINPGELVIFERGKDPRSIQVVEPQEGFCSFECSYFSQPDSMFNGIMRHEKFRKNTGAQVYKENKKFFNDLGGDVVVVPILDSGKHASWGFRDESNLPYEEAFVRRHHMLSGNGRSYTCSTQDERQKVAYRKLSLQKEKVADKTVITVDDSNVRGTTAKINNQRLRDAGANKVINVFTTPMVHKACKYGMDHQRGEELVAYRNDLDPARIAHEIGADAALYISLDGFDKLTKDYDAGQMCLGCLGGYYPHKDAK